MQNHQRFLKWISCGVFLIFITSCSLTGPKPDIVSEKKSPDEIYSNAEIRRMTVDQPHLMSGDYFRKRTEEDSHKPESGELLSESREKSDQSSKMAADPSTPHSRKKAVSSPAAPPDSAEYPLKVGMLLKKSGFSDSAAGRLMQAANQAIDKHMMLVNDTGMREVMASTDCPAESDIACIAEHAALYPGVRMMVTVNGSHLPEAFPGKAAVRLTVWDAALANSYPEIEITDRIERREQAGDFLQHAMARVFDYARRKAEVMPTHCRVFSVKENDIYINAGKMTGIPIGETFRVVSGGDTVTSPNGVPVGWVPENDKARIRVERLVGSDAAGCTLVKGEMPEPGAYVLLNALK